MVSMQIDQNDNVVSASSYNASFGLVRFSSLTGLPLNASASDSICFNKISILNANSIISYGYLLNNNKGIIAKMDSTLSSICSFTPVTASAVNYSLMAMQYSLTPYNLSISIETVSESLLNAATPVREQVCKPVPVVTDLSEMIIEGLRVYPNPASSQIFINAQEPCVIEIVSQLSQSVFTKELQTGMTRIETDQFSKGLYFLSCTNRSSKKQILKLLIE